MTFRNGLAQTKGAIVNIEWMNATLALPRLLRQQGRPRHWRRHGHREGTGVNEVAPGYIETTINEAGRQELAQYQCMADRTDFMRWGSLTMSPAG